MSVRALPLVTLLLLFFVGRHEDGVYSLHTRVEGPLSFWTASSDSSAAAVHFHYLGRRIFGSPVSAEQVVRTLLRTNPHCDIFVSSFFFLCCYCAYHGWDLKFFVCTLLDTFTRIGALRTDRRIPSFLHRLFPEGAALPQLRASIAVAEQHHLSRQAPVPAPAIAVGYRKPPVSQGNKTILFSPITDTRCKAHRFLRTALQTLTRVRTVEGQCAKILLEQ